jgi:heme-degrading monooxygenase HmoA
MIVRMWKGWTADDASADAYEAFLKESFLPSAAKLTGFRGAHVLRRQILSGQTEFVTLTRFDSIEALKAFAGEDYERARIAPRAHELLSRYDKSCTHYELAISDAELGLT